MIEAVVEQILDAILEVCPENWQQIALNYQEDHSEEQGAHKTIFFYVKAGGRFYDSGSLTRLCGVSMEELTQCFMQLDSLSSRGSEDTWLGYDLIIGDDGSFHVNYLYSPESREKFISKYIQ